ncbi:DNA-binding domain-containing protein [Thermophagus sp. OGC60D27]|uniref:HU family DNA-binding protein n=1 Tax=Thermophagus sp. OGC60D27 TaxID=3458415 RepID=UPI0040382626
MAFLYRLIKNPLKNSNENYIAVIHGNRTITEKELMDHMVNQGSTITMADVKAVLEALQKAIIFFLREGVNIKTRLFNFRLSIRGTFDSEEDYFTPSRHQLYVVCSPSKHLKEALSIVTPKRLNTLPMTPIIRRITDLHTNTINKLITANNVILVEGSRLKIDPNDPEQGIFFIDQNKNEIRPQKIHTNTPSRLLLSLPEDMHGPVEVEIRVPAFKDRHIKTFRFPYPLNVETLNG